MTQKSRTTETINRDYAAIREIMHSIRDLTVPDRATLAVGLVGHLATMMNRSQMAKLMEQLQEEARRVQDVPPSRQRDADARQSGSGSGSGSPAEPRDGDSGRSASGGSTRGNDDSGSRADGVGKPGHRTEGVDDSGRASESNDDSGRGTEGRGGRGDRYGARTSQREGGVGQAGRGAFRSHGLI
jgi:hypothetical protein